MAKSRTTRSSTPGAARDGALQQAVIAHKSGDLAVAGNLYRDILQREPRNADALHLLGVVAHQQGDLKLAISLHERAIGNAPTVATYHYHLGLAHQEMQQFARAAEAFRDAAQLQPGYAEAEHSLGLVLMRLGRVEDAVEAELRALAGNPQLLAAHTQLGELYRLQGDLDAAERHLRNALELDANHAPAHHTLGLALQASNRFDEADLHLRKAIALEPQAGESYYNIALGKRFTADDPDIPAMTRLLDTPNLGRNRRAALHFSLGKAYDDLTNYERAFHHYTEANGLMSSGFPMDQYRAQTRRIMQVYDRPFFVSRSEYGSRSNLPVFIVGMPRSGTTLVEQILASHPAVRTWGERRDIGRLVAEMSRRLGGATEYPECVTKLTSAGATQMAQAYLDRMPVDPLTLRAVDKAPLNFRHLGLVALLFPNAKIIHCRRHPLDVCLSCYFQNFRYGHAYTHEFRILAQFYNEYVRLMEHWRKVLPVPIYDVSYEELVRGPENVSRRMLNFCGLDWNDACLRFYDSARPVHTASHWQVRQPLYRRSLGRWKHYERFLGPLKEALGFREGDVLP